MLRDDFVRKIALGGVIVATATLSYSVLRERALHIGFPEWSSWFYPVGVDATILGASRIWQDVVMSMLTRRVARWVTLGAITAAIGAFVAEFIKDGWESVAFAILIPAALAASLVLTSLAAADRRAATPDPESEGTTDPEPKPLFSAPVDGTIHNTRSITLTPITVAPTTVVNTVDTPEARREWVHAELDAGRNVTGADVDRYFPNGARNGARIVRQVQSERLVT